MKRFIDGADRGQGTLFPECVEDWIGEDNPVRVIDVLVDGIDLAELGFGGVGSRGNRPAIVPSLDSPQAVHLRLSEPGAVEPAA